jgi:hypothetical protein
LRQAEQGFVHVLRGHVHGDHEQARDGADSSGKDDEPDFLTANQRS